MKRILTLFAALAVALSVSAQTAEEIIARMEKAFDVQETDGLYMTIDIKMPLLGTMSTKAWSLGKKTRIEARMMGKQMITWTDGTTEWTYDEDKNEIEIKDDTGSSSEDSGDAEMFTGITDGYDVSIKKETADSWTIHCKKSKNNKEKDDPKNMELVVAKGTYFPKSLSAKMSGVSMTMRDLSFNVTEEQVTFDPKKYPGAKVIDNRGK
jgi:outer membrane lipoprotein-sorting protein